jgi:sugar/nucleoside kinase (ribokinase family)
VAGLDVCVVGEINPDLVLYGVPKELEPERETLIRRFRLTLGSSSAIFAHNLSALGARVGIVSKIGSDALGQMALGWLSRGGVDVTRVRQAAEGSATGLTVILAQPAERFILTYPGTMFDLRYEDLDLDYVFSARHLHISSYFLQQSLRPKIAALFQEARRRGLTTSLDTNDDPAGLWAGDLGEVLSQVDIFFPNEREARNITRKPDLASAMADLSHRAGIVAVKLGAQGAVARKGEAEWRCSPLRVETVDTVGAGDSFDAGFILRFLEGAAIPQCLEYANAAGAYSTTGEGGIEAYCEHDRMAQFFEQRRSP